MLEVVLEGHGFHEFLDSTADLSLVAPGIDSSQVGSNSGEVCLDDCVSICSFRGDLGWDFTLQRPDSVLIRRLSSRLTIAHVSIPLECKYTIQRQSAKLKVQT